MSAFRFNDAADARGEPGGRSPHAGPHGAAALLMARVSVSRRRKLQPRGSSRACLPGGRHAFKTPGPAAAAQKSGCTNVIRDEDTQRSPRSLTPPALGPRPHGSCRLLLPGEVGSGSLAPVPRPWPHGTNLSRPPSVERSHWRRGHTAALGELAQKQMHANPFPSEGRLIQTVHLFLLL